MGYKQLLIVFMNKLKINILEQIFNVNYILIECKFITIKVKKLKVIRTINKPS